MKKIAIVTTHPVQYYAPIFKLLHERKVIAIAVFYTWGKDSMSKFDPGFNKTISWDIPLLENYPFVWVNNTSKKAGSHHFNGIINPDLIRQLKHADADAILFFGWAYHSHLKAIRYFKNRLPVYFRGDSTLLDQQTNVKNLLRSVFLKWVYNHIDVAFYTGTQNKAYFKKFGLKDEQLVFAPHAVDNDRFYVSRMAEANTLRNQLGLSGSDVLITFAGKFEQKKDPLLLLEAFLSCAEKNHHLLFVGNGVLEDVLKQKAEGNTRIHFMDFQNQGDMPVIYQACDIFCLPSQGPGETWGLAVNEAMASSKTVLVSNKVGCAIDLVQGDHNGAVFKAGDQADLQNKLKVLLTKADLKAFGKNSLKTINTWSIEHIAEAIENQLLNKNS